MGSGGMPPLPTAGQPAPMGAGEFTSASQPNQVSFAFTKIPPPSPIYIQRDDQLVVQAASTTSIDSVVFNVRLLLPTGVIVSLQNAVLLPAARTQVQALIPLAEGYLLSVTAQTLSGSTRGICFARAFINRGRVTPTQANAAMTLFADYVLLSHPVGWPNGRVIAPVEENGNVVLVNITTPAAGAEWSVLVPSNTRWRIISIAAQYAASAAVANRVPELKVDNNGASVYFTGPPNQVIVASTTVQVSCSTVVLPSTALVTDPMVPIPVAMILSQVQRIRSQTTNIQAADQWSSINMWVEEWLDLV